jgi:hypothetical protein
LKIFIIITLTVFAPRKFKDNFTQSATKMAAILKVAVEIGPILLRRHPYMHIKGAFRSFIIHFFANRRRFAMAATIFG